MADRPTDADAATEFGAAVAGVCWLAAVGLVILAVLAHLLHLPI